MRGASVVRCPSLFHLNNYIMLLYKLSGSVVIIIASIFVMRFVFNNYLRHEPIGGYSNWRAAMSRTSYTVYLVLEGILSVAVSLIIAAIFIFALYFFIV